MEPLVSQIREAVELYDGTDVQAAMLSGMSLVASYLAKHDGSKRITAAAVLHAVNQVALEKELIVGRLDDPPEGRK